MVQSGSASEATLVQELILTFNELNVSKAEEIVGAPTALEFMRFVSRNTPFISRGAAADWPAVGLWTADYLTRRLAGRRVAVAVTPTGKADAPTTLSDGTVVFAKPLQESRDFGEVLRFMIEQERGLHGQEQLSRAQEVWYAQTQNDNLRDEYAALADDVERDVGFATTALCMRPDATNVWLGNSHSTTALHRDNYENVYVQLVGRKHFVLLSPVCQPCVAERSLCPATYIRQPTGALRLALDHPPHLYRPASPSTGDVPFPLWDPDLAAGTGVTTKFSTIARPVRVTLEPGDLLYLPAMWYHKVTQSCVDGGEGFVAAVNYWYDMEFGGPLYPLCTMVRNLGLQDKGMEEEKERLVKIESLKP